MPIHAKPQRNGNTPDHFRGAALELMRAGRALEKALALLRTDVFHGRNYQHFSDPGPAPARRAKDMARVQFLEEARQEMSTLADDIATAISEGGA